MGFPKALVEKAIKNAIMPVLCASYAVCRKRGLSLTPQVFAAAVRDLMAYHEECEEDSYINEFADYAKEVKK